MACLGLQCGQRTCLSPCVWDPSTGREQSRLTPHAAPLSKAHVPGLHALLHTCLFFAFLMLHIRSLPSASVMVGHKATQSGVRSMLTAGVLATSGSMAAPNYYLLCFFVETIW